MWKHDFTKQCNDAARTDITMHVVVGNIAWIFFTNLETFTSEWLKRHVSYVQVARLEYV